MNDFFRSKTFKIIAVLLAAVLAFFLRAVYTGGLMPALSHIGGAVATPFGEFSRGSATASRISSSRFSTGGSCKRKTRTCRSWWMS